jgi:hypothetical protein
MRGRAPGPLPAEEVARPGQRNDSCRRAAARAVGARGRESTVARPNMCTAVSFNLSAAGAAARGALRNEALCPIMLVGRGGHFSTAMGSEMASDAVGRDGNRHVHNRRLQSRSPCSSRSRSRPHEQDRSSRSRPARHCGQSRRTGGSSPRRRSRASGGRTRASCRAGPGRRV